MTCYTKAELAVALVTLLTGEPVATAEAPPELGTILDCAAALPEDTHYVIYDYEATPPPKGLPLNVFAEQKIAAWDGSLPNSSGYGWVGLIQTQAGPALAVTCGGSVGASAQTFWVMPNGIEGWVSLD